MKSDSERIIEYSNLPTEGIEKTLEVIKLVDDSLTDRWIVSAVEAYSKKTGYGNFSEAVKSLLLGSLSRLGYLENTFKPMSAQTLGQGTEKPQASSPGKIIQFPTAYKSVGTGVAL